MRKFPEQKTVRRCAVVAVAVSAILPCYSQQPRSERQPSSISKKSPESERATRERGNRGPGELRKLSDLKAVFDRDNGKVRLVVLVSPT